MKKYSCFSGLFIGLCIFCGSYAPTHAQTDDITYSWNYLTNQYGYNYGAEFYLYNNTPQTFRVYYRLEENYNVNIQSDGGITDVPPFTKVWIITVVTADMTIGWSSGELFYNWEKPEK